MAMPTDTLGLALDNLLSPPVLGFALGLLAVAVGGDLRFSILNWRSLEWEGKPRAAVERYVEEFSMLSGIPVDLEVRGRETILPKERLRDLLRIMRLLQRTLCGAQADVDLDRS